MKQKQPPQPGLFDALPPEEDGPAPGPQAAAPGQAALPAAGKGTHENADTHAENDADQHASEADDNADSKADNNADNNADDSPDNDQGHGWPFDQDVPLPDYAPPEFARSDDSWSALDDTGGADFPVAMETPAGDPAPKKSAAPRAQAPAQSADVAGDTIALDAIAFPLHGSRLIEASAGTGKTWTIAALYLRLVLGHGGAQGFVRPLLPSEILVMTFTRAATRELSDRIRQRLVEAARFFRGEESGRDPYLLQLLQDHAPGTPREQAAHRLQLAAETMDEAAVFTIDAWCQRMLREHAFDSGSLFDEELLADESTLFADAARDYWRQQVYPLGGPALQQVRAVWGDLPSLLQAMRRLAPSAALFNVQPSQPLPPLAALIGRHRVQQQAALAPIKAGWRDRANRMQAWIAARMAHQAKTFSAVKLHPQKFPLWFDALRDWADDAEAVWPDPAVFKESVWARLTVAGITDAFNKNMRCDVPDELDGLLAVKEQLDALEPLAHLLTRHAALSIAQRIADLKERGGQYGFADLLARLKAALEGPNGDALRTRILTQYPVALIDEFQDTSPDQYRVFDLLYRVAANDADSALLLIGDPKQSIYGFRGADIHSYLAARVATTGRHYLLGTNFRSSEALVRAVNRVFLHAEGVGGEESDDAAAGFAAGAFRFRNDAGNPLPFAPVAAQGRDEQLVSSKGPVDALTFWQCDADGLKGGDYRKFFATHCAEHIVGLLNDAQAGFRHPDRFERLQPADIAVLVRDRTEAAAIRRALQQRGVASVYLSDSDSVMRSAEAGDLLRWLRAVAAPLDDGLARAAFATRTADFTLGQLAQLAADDMEWEARVEQLKDLHAIWQRQGVLAMLRRFIHQLQLPARLLHQAGGERRLTNLLHLAELLQGASQQLEGEQALIRWLAEQIVAEGAAADDRILRLESDAALVKVVTVHKAKGLEYALVCLPFAVSARPAEKRNRTFFEYTDEAGARRLDLSLSDEVLARVEAARIEEDLRLLYVALTRARHALWLGVAAVADRKAGSNRLSLSALGYLLAGGEQIPLAQLLPQLTTLRGDCLDMVIQTVSPQDPAPFTRLDRHEAPTPLRADAGALYTAQFERDWSIGSFTSLARSLGAPAVAAPEQAIDEQALDERPDGGVGGSDGADGLPIAAAPIRAREARLLDADDGDSALLMRRSPQDAPWHRFPRGVLPGLFLHEQLEWMAQEGFAIVDSDNFETRLAARIDRAGWGHRYDDALAWLRAIATTALPPLGAALRDLPDALAEMEFWFPSERLHSEALDQLCRTHLLDGMARPALPPRQLHGMLKGFIDLVFERDGRYWIVDYKSNALGGGDAAYDAASLAGAVAAHRYDVQGALYALALHRLLQSRLGAAYDSAQHLGGAVIFFLRGVGNEATRGCHVLYTPGALLDDLDALFGDHAAKESP